MTVSASSYEAKVSDALVTMLSASSTFQSITTAASAALAKGFIVEDDGGETAKAVDGGALVITGPWATVRITDSRRPERAWMTWGREGDAMILLILRKTSGDSPAEIIRRARNQAGAICDEMQAQVGGASLLSFATFELGEVTHTEESGALADALYAPITITWRDIP